MEKVEGSIYFIHVYIIYTRFFTNRCAVQFEMISEYMYYLHRLSSVVIYVISYLLKYVTCNFVQFSSCVYFYSGISVNFFVYLKTCK